TSTTTATLSAEVDQPGASGFPEYTGERVVMADLTFADGDLLDGQVTASAVLTQGGAEVYAETNEDFRAGAKLDDVLFGIGEEAGQPDPTTPTSVTAKASRATVCTGGIVTLQATAKPAIAGAVTFRDGGTQIGDAITTKDGRAAVKTRSLAKGQHAITARFAPSGDGYAASRSAEVTVAVVDCGTGGSSVEGSMEWGVKKSFRDYVVGSIAHGKIAAKKGATQAKQNGEFTFPQAARGTSWNGRTGTVQYAGQVTFRGHHGVMDVTIANPSIRVTSASKAELRIPYAGRTITFATIDLASGMTRQLSGDAVRFTGAKTTLTKAGTAFFSYEGSSFYEAGQELDRITFTVGEGSDVETSTPAKPGASAGGGKKSSGSSPAAAAAPAEDGAGAGSLTWGVSSAFVAYTTCEGKERFGYSHCAKGSVSTSGVGSGYLFPQAAGSDWDPETQTGTVSYSGVVSFQGYGMTMFSVSNPSITVDGPSSATLHTGNGGNFGAASYPLDLSGATKSEGDDGEVTWSGVGVRGSLTGGPGGGSANSVGFDDLSFTVGTASASSFGDTNAGEDEPSYTAAAAPPTTTGLEVLTPADRIREAGRIQVRASGFEADDSGVLVVLYESGDGAEPIVLDDEAGADESGTVEWSGTLPDEGTGDYVLTLQGSSDAGAEIAILEEQTSIAADAVVDAPEADQGAAAVVGGPSLPTSSGGMALWEWWAIAASLMAIAACTSVLAIRQRRAVAA
ncbi:MAG: HtaA domain-containing protein, partial [Microbacterium sp.]